MKNIISSLMLSFIVSSTTVFAHFGTKGPYGGTVTCALVSDTMVYIGTAEGGVFHNTTQSLSSWRARPVGLKSGKITALTYTGKYLISGTADSGVYIFNGFVGNDRYWNKINNGLSNLEITSLTYVDSITIIAGTNGGGVFKTENKGSSWTTVNTGLTSLVINGLLNADGRLILIADNGVFASDDDGDTWTSLNDGNTTALDCYAMAYNEGTDELMVVNSNGLYVATSASSTSSPVYTLATTGLPGGVDVRSISTNGLVWFLATDMGVYASLASGISWNAINTGLTPDQLNVNTVVPYQTRLVMGTKDEGVFKSNASSVSWVAFNNAFNNVKTYSLTTGGANLIATSTEKGVFVSKDLAASYQRANQGLIDSLNVTDLVFVDTRLFASTKNEGVFMSLDSGATWTSFNSGLTEANIKKIVALNSNLYAFGATGIVYKATGFGWSSIQAGLPSGVEPTSIVVYNSTLALSTLGDGVFTRNESSGNWVASNAGLTNLNVTSLTASATKLFLGTDGAGVFSSDFSSINWSSVSPTTISHTTMIGLDGTKIQAMAYYEGYVYASYKGGLLATADNGATWIAGGNQFNLPSYTDVSKISFVTTRVFVSTEYNSLYSNSLSELPVITSVEYQKVQAIASAFAIVPNPNNGTYRLDLGRYASEIEDVVVYDGLGNLVTKLTKDQVAVSQTYSSGMYYVQVTTGAGIFTKKMIVQ